MVAPQEKVTKGITEVNIIYPQGNINGSNKFVPIQLVDIEIFHRISANFDLLVAQQKVRGSPKSKGFILWAP